MPKPDSAAPLNAFELMKAMIEAGAACVHFEDQLSSAKKCGHLGGKVLVPTQEAVQKLIAARLAADVLGVPTLGSGAYRRQQRASADRATSIPTTASSSPASAPWKDSIAFTAASTRPSRADLPTRLTADLIWCETSEPNLKEAERFAEAIHAKYPG